MLKFLKKLIFDPGFQRKKAFLRSLEIFQDISGKDLGFLAQSLHARTYHEGEALFMEGDIGRALFILESGKVDITKLDASGKPQHVFTVEPGGFFGEMALLEQLPRSATATATQSSHVHLLYRTKLEEILHRRPRIGVSIMNHLARLLSARLRRASSLALADSPASRA